MATQYAQILVDGDPNIWTLRKPVSDPAEIIRSSAPLALGVRRPFDGILLLSVKAAAFVTLLPSPGAWSQTATGWVYDDFRGPSPILYLPSVSIPATGPVLYQTPAGTTLAELQSTLTTAMTRSQRASVSFEVAGSLGQVMVNGATLPFAVIVSPGTSLPPQD
jgi:hypothetical protein